MSARTPNPLAPSAAAWHIAPPFGARGVVGLLLVLLLCFATGQRVEMGDRKSVV